MEKPGSKPIACEKLCSSSIKRSYKKGTPKLCCWVCIFSVLFVILACPGLDPFDRKYASLNYAAYFDSHNVDICRGRRVYMYDLPHQFNVDVYKTEHCNRSLIPWMDLCPRFGNGGFGLKLWNESEPQSDEDFDNSNWFDTDSYMLEMIFHSRMQKYECLTNQTAEADAFFVPYYTGLLALRYLYQPLDLEGGFARRKIFGVELIEWLESNGGKAWKRFGGRDHFLIMGRTTWDFKLFNNDWGTDFSHLPYVANMTNLLIESHPSLENEHAIPYPTSFHPSSPQRLERWIDGVKNSKRKYLFSYVGAPRPDSSSVRGLIASACLDAGESVCNLVNCSVVRCSHDPVPIYKSFLQANFCLQPRGDTSTRRSAFDCLISGAIPVFFHNDTAYTQYSWHLPQEPEKYSVYISEEDLKTGVSVEERLMAYSAEQISEMRSTIIPLIPSLLYNDFVDPRSPMKDAFDVSIAAVLNRIAAVKKQMTSSYSCWISFRSRNCFFGI